METKRIEEADFATTGYSYTLSLIAGKYKPIILYCLMECTITWTGTVARLVVTPNWRFL